MSSNPQANLSHVCLCGHQGYAHVTFGADPAYEFPATVALVGGCQHARCGCLAFTPGAVPLTPEELERG